MLVVFPPEHPPVTSHPSLAAVHSPLTNKCAAPPAYLYPPSLVLVLRIFNSFPFTTTLLFKSPLPSELLLPLCPCSFSIVHSLSPKLYPPVPLASLSVERAPFLLVPKSDKFHLRSTFCLPTIESTISLPIYLPHPSITTTLRSL